MEFDTGEDWSGSGTAPFGQGQAMAGDERPRMLRVALLNPPVTSVLEEEYDRPDFPRPVLAVLAGYLRKRKLQADLLLIDSKMERLDFGEVVDRTTRFGPHVIGITALTNEIDDAATLGEQLKRALPEAIIVIGGFMSLLSPWLR
jgi:CheY-like chemotaxis protein